MHSLARGSNRSTLLARSPAAGRRQFFIPRASAAASPLHVTPTRLLLKAKKNSVLAIGWLPQFSYDAGNSGGWADVTSDGDFLQVKFNAEGMNIPDLNWRTAAIFGVPLPPPLNIAIHTLRLEGTVDPASGDVRLEFDAEFMCTIGRFYSSPPLVVCTVLTTGYTHGHFREGTGSPFLNGKGKLAGTSRVPKTGDLFVDLLLSLPTDALAILDAELEFDISNNDPSVGLARMQCLHTTRGTAVARRRAGTRMQRTPTVAVRATVAPADKPAIPLAKTPTRMRLTAKKGSALAIGIYPMFSYDAQDGGGWAEVTADGSLLHVKFDAAGMIIPDLNWRSTTILGVPIPPPLNIAIQTDKLEGTVNTATGEVQLTFDAQFKFTVGPLYKAPPLFVRTTLTTGYTKGRFREGTGSLFNNGKGRLAATAEVPKTGDLFMDSFLILPTDALALLEAELDFE